MTSTFYGLSSHIHSRFLIVNDLNIHILEASPQSVAANSTLGNPKLIVLLHGFPELAYSWRHIMVPLRDAGYHVVAPDIRGYGRTRKRSEHDENSTSQLHDRIQYLDDLAPYRMLNLATDIVSLVYALGYASAAAIIGHDFGSPLAGLCALIRPDLFTKVVMMSAPYTGPPPPTPPSTDGGVRRGPSIQQLTAALAMLTPPRKHYTVYFSTPHANTDMLQAPQGFREFLLAYYHMKSGDWEGNTGAEDGPIRLSSPLSIADLAVLPEYYVMPLDKTMAEVVRPHAPSLHPSSETGAQRASWLSDGELDVYVSEYRETGFQGGLNQYRCLLGSAGGAGAEEDLYLFSGKRLEVPAMYLAGRLDWGIWQSPGAVEKMRREFCKEGTMREENFVLVDGAGHWVQQEKPAEVVAHLLRFLGESSLQVGL